MVRKPVAHASDRTRGLEPLIGVDQLGDDGEERCAGRREQILGQHGGGAWRENQSVRRRPGVSERAKCPQELLQPDVWITELGVGSRKTGAQLGGSGFGHQADHVVAAANPFVERG